MAQVVVEQRAPCAPERLLHRAHLHQHVGAIALLLDHLLEPAHLSLDPAQSGEQRLLGLRCERHRVDAVSRAEAWTGRRFARRVVSAHARRSLRLLVTTLTLLTAIAAAASAGVSRIPNAG